MNQYYNAFRVTEELEKIFEILLERELKCRYLDLSVYEDYSPHIPDMCAAQSKIFELDKKLVSFPHKKEGEYIFNNYLNQIKEKIKHWSTIELNLTWAATFGKYQTEINGLDAHICIPLSNDFIFLDDNLNFGGICGDPVHILCRPRKNLSKYYVCRIEEGEDDDFELEIFAENNIPELDYYIDRNLLS